MRIPARDEAEIALVRAARARDLPLLGVCRGLQLLAVADGGSLVSDLGPDLPHVKPEVGHPVDLAPDPSSGRCSDPASVVSSLHHQGVATLGADWRATAWSADGVVEGAEWGDRTVGVQWHPELDASGPALFGWLMATAGQAAV